MAKIIKMTPEYIEECRTAFQEAFEKAMSNVKLSDGKIQFTKTIGHVDRKAIVFFSEKAYLKMISLIRDFNDEVAWHGTAFRSGDDTKDWYYIDDILVYPQTVTGSTVNTDQEKYQTWLMSHEDDVFNNIRFQGHSHVNMGVTPSGVDTTHQEQLLEQLEDDMFYIFMIWNKRSDVYSKIYDMKKNIMFETSDVTIKVLDGEYALDAFLKESHELVQKKVYTYNQNNYQQGYGRSPYYQGDGKPYNPLEGKTGAGSGTGNQGTLPPANTSGKKEEKPSGTGKKDKKDKKKDKKRTTVSNGNYVAPVNAGSTQLSMYDYDEDDDPSSPFYSKDGPWNAYGGY